ncbi:MAG: hypothetical protein AAGA36_00325 [Pseudomonadota bacterium]
MSIAAQTPVDPSDKQTNFCVEPQWIWDALFKHEALWGVVCDPSCGTGTSLRSAEATGMPGWCLGYDLLQRGSTFQVGTRDIFDLPSWGNNGCGILISNPPFYSGKGWVQFVALAHQFAKHKAIMIGSDKVHYSGERHSLWAEFPVTRIYHFSDRPSMPFHSTIDAMGSNAFKNGAINYSAYVWDFTAPQRGNQTFYLKKDGSLT